MEWRKLVDCQFGKDLRFAIGTSDNGESQNAQESMNKNRFDIDKIGCGYRFKFLKVA